ncbi:serine/threonine-protein kinase haspin-like isoform X2 [Dermacentor albipictus]|uniref:serine/threonine-protein kinase haspin-like isoform X2 n=1 Tax=Dermacentor albipictus TaxID=60249 RepID=UPI0038FD2B5A
MKPATALAASEMVDGDMSTCALVAVGTVLVLLTIAAIRQKRRQRVGCGKDNAKKASSIDEIEREAHRCRLDVHVSRGARIERLAASFKSRSSELLSREAGDSMCSRAGIKRQGPRNATNASSVPSASTAAKASLFLGDPPRAALSSPLTGSKGAAVFGDLLSACHQRLPTTFVQLFDGMEADRFTSIARGRLSEVFRVHSYKGDSVLKLVKIDSVISSWDHLFTETLIGTKLSDLRTTKQHYTDGFLEIKSTTCVFGSYPRELCVRGRNDNNQTDERCPGKAHTESPYLAVHMSYGGVPLHRIQLDSARQLLSVLQQVALALAVAEEALQFEHRNLHAGHVLVKKTHDDTCRFRVGGRDIVVNTRGLRAHVTGYGLARMTDAETSGAASTR